MVGSCGTEAIMTRDWYDAQWFCGYCGAQYVVPILARDCERTHESPASPTGDKN